MTVEVGALDASREEVGESIVDRIAVRGELEFDDRVVRVPVDLPFLEDEWCFADRATQSVDVNHVVLVDAQFARETRKRIREDRGVALDLTQVDCEGLSEVVLAFVAMDLEHRVARAGNRRELPDAGVDHLRLVENVPELIAELHAFGDDFEVGDRALRRREV